MLIIILSFTSKSKAQIKASVGIEFLHANKNLSEIAINGLGSTAEGIYEITERFSVNLQIGYIHLFVTDKYKSAYLMPFQIGCKLHFNSTEKGFYFHPQLGKNRLSTTTNDFVYDGVIIYPQKTTIQISNTYALGMGYMVNEHFDLSFRYNLASNGYLGFRIGYVF